MSDQLPLSNPWVVAVWPGMGQVALSAGYYLLAKLGMYQLAEFAARELFEVEHVEVKAGLVHAGRLPRSRMFVWIDPDRKHDVIVFIGEAQPPHGKYAFCRRLIEYAQELGVQRVFTFAAMASQMHPRDESRVYGVAADQDSLEELKRLELEILQDGQISGLNGVLLGVAAEAGMRGTCLLGEMPHLFAPLPFPKASLAVLEVFTTIAGIELDFSELRQQAQTMEENLDELLGKLQQAMRARHTQEEDQWPGAEPNEEEKGLSPDDRQRIERLFRQAQRDRSKAYELKQELDRLGVFREYEDRFLDLFNKPR